MQICLY